MAASLPVFGQISWPSLVPQFVLVLLFEELAKRLGFEQPTLAGLCTFTVLFVILRWSIPRNHRRGIRLVKEERFADAIQEFRQSYEFFSKHAWLDRWRAITVLSASRASYREMALVNLGFCLSQTGERNQAIAEYERALREFPGSKMAETALRMLGARGSAP